MSVRSVPAPGHGGRATSPTPPSPANVDKLRDTAQTGPGVSGEMAQNGERLSARLSEQIGAVIESGLERHVRLDASSPEEQALEERINALVDAARGRAPPRAGPRWRHGSSAGCSTRSSRTRRPCSS